MSTPSLSRETQILHPPFPSSNQDDTSTLYNLSVSGETAGIQVLPMDYPSNVRYNIVNLTIKSSQPITYRKPIEIREDIDLDEWKRSLTYNERQVENLLGEILSDFGLELTEENLVWLRSSINNLINLYQMKYKTNLPAGTTSMIFNLLVRIAYDRLCLHIPQ